MWRREVGLFVAACILVSVVLLVGNNHWQRLIHRTAPVPTGTGPDYSHAPATWVGRQACAECHAQADSVWTGSDHDLAMQLPRPETITADFDNATYTHYGVTSTFYREGEKYMVRTDGPDGKLTDFEVAYVFGYFPLEQFLIRFPDGRMQCLNVCWDTTPAADGGQRWFHLYPDDETPATDLFHWTGPLQNWNFMCADCHSTNLKRNYDVASNTFETTWSELDVSCEACHGPGSRHIQWEKAQAQGLRPANLDGARGLVANLKSPDNGLWVFEPGEATARRTEPLASRIETESCARCHARRGPLTEEHEYGQRFLDNYRLILLDEELYYADGQNQDEVYVYGSFMQSKMYAAGVTCSDCHDYHSTRTLGEADQVCARCHRAEVFDTPEHHFHQPDKGGDSCLDCHQQARKVMVVDARRDHSFRIPRPDLSLELGTPNACNDCHTDKSLQWSQDAIVKWYGADRKQGGHYGVALHAGRTGAPLALDRLRALLQAEDQPNMAKATGLSLMNRYAAAADVAEVVTALKNEDPLVRAAAVDALATSPAERQYTLCQPLLDDPV
ncbi:MAG: multiheme c-type cytochrome, partial [Candidatus Krumholzibacteria bacterium]|nr:multiheme c-type cytochrome [Candidatus Krumholzibacteria bacterium]